MKNLDDKLKHALRREEPPEGFAERVLRQAGQGAAEHRRTLPFVESGFSRIAPPEGGARVGGSHVVDETIRLKPYPTYAKSIVGWAAAAAVFVALAGGGIQYRMARMERARAERAVGEAAGRQVVLALQIAGSKLQLVQTKIARMHQQPDNQ